jgi:hypothetical protein
MSTAITPSVSEDSDFGIRTLKARLAAKLVKVLGEIEPVPKSGRNKEQGYDYVRASDIVAATRKVLARNGVFLKWLPDPELHWREYQSRNNNLQREVTVWYDAVFMDAETGYEESIPWPGVGTDSGDKNLAKAATAAMKSFLATQFQIPDDGADNDRDTGTEEGSRARSASRSERQQPARVENVWPKKITGILQKIEAHQDGSWLFVKGARFWVRKTDVELKLAGITGKLIEFEADMGKGPDGLPCPVLQKLLAAPPTTPQTSTAAAPRSPQAATAAQPGVKAQEPARAAAAPQERAGSVPVTHDMPGDALERELEAPPSQPSAADLFGRH